ncbi:L,D-transpeptidase family protein [Verrucomicrobiota bacterium sgz303538]
MILCASAQDDIPSTEVIVSVADQQLALIREGELVAKFPISTSKFGLGDARGSYKTPLGKLRVCDKIGDNLAAGTVLKGRETTGEVLAVNAPGRDPIVTRILWLEGTEEQNRNARARAIYIHGTPEENRLGQPVSWGCIRMRSRDVIALYEQVSEGTSVTIIPERLPRLHKDNSHSDAILALSKPVAPKTSVTPPLPQLSPTRELMSALTPGSMKAPSGKKGAFDAMQGSILFSGISEPPAAEGAGIPQ